MPHTNLFEATHFLRDDVDVGRQLEADVRCRVREDECQLWRAILERLVLFAESANLAVLVVGVLGKQQFVWKPHRLQRVMMRFHFEAEVARHDHNKHRRGCRQPASAG